MPLRAASPNSPRCNPHPVSPYPQGHGSRLARRPPPLAPTMSLRSKLILAFLLLSVVPLSALVLYSYLNSTATLRRVAFEESTELASEMKERMSLVKDDLARRVRRLGRLPLGELAAHDGGGDGRRALLAEVEAAFGEVAPFVEALEFVPREAPEAPSSLAMPPPPAAAPVAPVPPAPRAPRPPRTPRVAGAAAVTPLPEVGVEHAERAMSHLVIRLDSPARTAGDAERRELAAEKAERVLLQDLIAAQTDAALKLAGRSLEASLLAAAPVAGAALSHSLEAGLPTVEPATGLDPEARRALAQRAAESKKLLGRDFNCPVEASGKAIGALEARVSAKQVLHAVLALSRRDRGEIPFALDPDGAVYTANPADRATLEQLPVRGDQMGKVKADGWVMVKVKDADSGLVYGIASPLQQSLVELRRTAARNFVLGLGLIGFALVGIAPLSRRITRELSELAEGARALASGNLSARVPVRTKDEVGQLAASFNRMAADLAEHQRQLIEQQRLAQEREIERLLLATENERKTCELEEARRFQLSLLPKKLPEHPRLDLAVFMRTATEVGGDYYDFLLGEGGALTLAVGDATGHGATAGTLVTVAKSLFVARAADSPLAAFLGEANRAIKSMELGRMAMALALARVDGGRLTLAAAGMPPALVYRAATGAVDELAVEGLPLGSLAECTYREVETALAPGDAVLLMSDGFPELRDGAGEPLGYARAQAIFAASATKAPADLIADLEHAVSKRKSGAPPDDDVTFVAIKVRGFGMPSPRQPA